MKRRLPSDIKLQFQDRTIKGKRLRRFQGRAGMIRLPERHMHGRFVMVFAGENGEPAQHHQIVPVTRGRCVRPPRGGYVKRLVRRPGKECVQRQECPFGFAGKFLRVDFLQAKDIGLQFQKLRAQRPDPRLQLLRLELVVPEGFDVECSQPDQGFLPQRTGFQLLR